MTESFAIVRYEDGDEELLFSADINTPHIARVLLDEGVFDTVESLENALQRAFDICLILSIPIDRHFKRIHIHEPGVYNTPDWALSDVAWYLLLLNGGIGCRYTSQAQAYAIRRILARH